MVGKIKEKKSSEAVEEVIDKKRNRISTKILIGFAVAVMFAIGVYALKQLFDCSLSECYFGGAGAGSLIVIVIWLMIESLKP